METIKNHINFRKGKQFSLLEHIFGIGRGRNSRGWNRLLLLPHILLSVITSYLTSATKDNNKFMFILLRRSFFLKLCFTYLKRGQVRPGECLWLRPICHVLSAAVLNDKLFWFLFGLQLLHAGCLFPSVERSVCSGRWINNFYCYCAVFRDAINRCDRLDSIWKRGWRRCCI